ncbi:MAG: hypothetical protein Q9162_006534 [Coniocarpon cinnabarinum]
MGPQGPTSPFIKNEPDDLFDPNRFHKSSDTFGQHNSSQHYGPWHSPAGVDGLGMDINPAALSQSMSNGQSNLPSSYAQGGSAITDDELLSSFTMNTDAHQQNGVHQFQAMNGMNGNFQQHRQQQPNGGSSMNVYSSTPDGAPIQSPFDRGNFDFGQWQTVNHQGQLATPVSAGIGPNSMQDNHTKPSMTPMTPHMNGLQLGSSPNSNFSGQTMSGRGMLHGRQSSSGGQWDNSLGSGQSHLDSPLSSPGAPMHAQISEVLKAGTPASPPARGKATTTAEMKKAKRRASHNEVERRRRNHINDRINELADLVPKHRLEDDAIRRSVMSNAGMPMPMGGHSISPPATSGLAGSHGRRAASISQSAAPADDKDKGPAKGDVLDGTVDWTRDLLWLVNNMLSRQSEMEGTINNLNGPVARPWGEDEKRMLSEVHDAIAKNRIGERQYTRRHGTSLYVPKFTNHAGEPVESPSQAAASPGILDLDPTQAVNGNMNGSQYLWNGGSGLKEEDELLDFEMN